MAYDVDSGKIGTIRNAAASAPGQYRAVRISSAGRWEICPALARADGIVQDAPGVNQAPTCWTGDGYITKVVAGGTIAAGALLEVGASGALRSDTGVGGHLIARAIEAAVNGQIFSVLWKYYGPGVVTS